MLNTLTYNNSFIHFGSLHESKFQTLLRTDFAQSKKIIITDETVYDLWIQDLVTNYSELAKAEIIQIPPGEDFKNMEVCMQIWSALSEYEIGRNDLIINFGGGVVTDLGGFVASLFKRGLPFINIPTTLLAQVDASVGGKTGIDLGPYKNQIGVFSDPAHVFIDERYLESLPEDQLNSGYGEMLKHGLIADEEHWNSLMSFDPTSEGRLAFIYDSVLIKKTVVSADHKETGLRKILNFGHTIGHAIEGLHLEKGEPVLHGYAVVWGMMAEAYIAHELELLDTSEFAEIRLELIERFPLPVLKDADYKRILKLMYNDKKNKSNTIRFSLIDGIGSCVFDIEANDKLVIEALKGLKIL